MRRSEYEQLIEQGAFVGRRCELVDGEVVDMSPQGDLHAGVVEVLAAMLTRQLGPAFRVRCQLPIVLGDRSEPEPDLVVAPGPPARTHPRWAHLVVEVADSSLERDEGKARVYARAELPEYWLIDLGARVVRVHTAPDPVRGVYGAVALRRCGEVLRVEALPAIAVAVSDLLG
jgi:Uma2 family endonuclease